MIDLSNIMTLLIYYLNLPLSISTGNLANLQIDWQWYCNQMFIFSTSSFFLFCCLTSINILLKEGFKK